jgi:TonB-dependent receptor
MESGLTPEANEAQPLDMFKYAIFDLDQFFGGIGTGHGNNGVYDLNYTGQLDLKVPFTIAPWLSGSVKFGGKLKQKQRDREVYSYGNPDGAAYELAFRDNFPEYERNGSVYPFRNFIDESYTGYESMFEPHNQIPFVFDPEKKARHFEVMSAIDSLWRRNVGNYFDEYEALERITAGYAMAEIRLGRRLTLIPGFRFENTFLDYAGVSGTRRNNEPWRVVKTDTSATNSTGEFLPMVHLKWEFIDGLALRLAATKTLSRPNFLNLTPFTQIEYTNQRVVTFGAIDLKIPTAWNYDAVLTWFSKFGLFSVGGFYKEIYDIDVNVNFFDYSGTAETNPWYGWIVNSPINLDQTTSIYGMEFEAQTNFRWLPKPFDGIVLSGNYSLIRSETYYPFYYIDYPPPDYLPVTADSFRIESTQGQADFVANVTLGYEKGGFSGNVSMNYQGPKFTSLGNTPFQDGYDDKYFRWDATLTYKITENWQVILNLINFTNETERGYIYTAPQTSSIEAYGWQVNLAVRYWFK